MARPLVRRRGGSVGRTALVVVPPRGSRLARYGRSRRVRQGRSHLARHGRVRRAVRPP